MLHIASDSNTYFKICLFSSMFSLLVVPNYSTATPIDVILVSKFFIAAPTCNPFMSFNLLSICTTNVCQSHDILVAMSSRCEISMKGRNAYEMAKLGSTNICSMHDSGPLVFAHICSGTR